MRPIVKAHPKPEICIAYALREGAEPLGGTLPALEPARMVAHVKALSRGRRAVHVTLSLPKGLRAEDELWLRIVMTTLSGLAVDPYAHGWFATRHTDTACDHIHIVLAGCDFRGVPVELANTRAQTDRLHQQLAVRLGLELPTYYDPAIPSLRPVQPARRLKSALAKRLHADLVAAFLTQPTSLNALNARMRALPGGYQSDARATRWSSPEGSLYGDILGPGWEGQEIFKRLAHAASLIPAQGQLALNSILRQLLPCQTQLMEILNGPAFLSHPPAPAEGWRDPAERSAAPRPEAGSHHQFAAGPAEQARSRAAGSGAAAGQRADHDREGGHRAAAGARGAEERDHRSERPVADARQDFGGNLQAIGHPPRLTLAELLRRTLRHLRRRLPGWRLLRHGDKPCLSVHFADGSAVDVATTSLCRRAAGAEADAFIADCQAEFPEPKPRPLTRPNSDPQVKVARPTQAIPEPARHREKSVPEAHPGEAEGCNSGASPDAGSGVEAACDDEKEALVKGPPRLEAPDPASSPTEEEEPTPDPEDDWDGPGF